MPRYRYLLIALAVWAAIWSAYRLWPAAEPEPELSLGRPISDAVLARLEKMANSACECQMQGGDPATCNRNYDKAKARYEPMEGATACAPISTVMDCFGERSDQCIVTRYSAGVRNEFVCTNEQAEALQAAWSEGYEKSGESYEAANQAMAVALKNILDGKALTAVPPKEGCV